MTPLELFFKSSGLENTLVDICDCITGDLDFPDYYEKSDYSSINHETLVFLYHKSTKKLLGYYVIEDSDCDVLEIKITKYGSEILLPYCKKILDSYQNKFISMLNSFDIKEDILDE